LARALSGYWSRVKKITEGIPEGTGGNQGGLRGRGMMIIIVGEQTEKRRRGEREGGTNAGGT
jgi:hypothetical protein